MLRNSQDYVSKFSKISKQNKDIFLHLFCQRVLTVNVGRPTK